MSAAEPLVPVRSRRGRCPLAESPILPGRNAPISLFTPQNALGWRIFGYWGALGSVLAFLVYFPRSKHIHIFMAPAKHFVPRSVTSGVLPAVVLDMEAESPKLGAKMLEGVQKRAGKMPSTGPSYTATPDSTISSIKAIPTNRLAAPDTAEQPTPAPPAPDLTAQEARKKGTPKTTSTAHSAPIGRLLTEARLDVSSASSPTTRKQWRPNQAATPNDPSSPSSESAVPDPVLPDNSPLRSNERAGSQKLSHPKSNPEAAVDRETSHR